MGLFKRIVGGFASAVGSGVEKFGRIIRSDKIENAGRSIRNYGDSLAYDIGKTRSYDTGSGTVRQTQDLSVTLANYSKNVELSVDETQHEIEGVIKDFFNDLSQIADENSISLPRGTIRKEQQDVLRAQDGFLKGYIAKRLSLDDRGCLEILKMEEGYDKEQAMRNFTRTVLREGKQKLCDRIRDAVLALLDSFGDAFDNMVEDQDLLLQNAERALNALQDDTPSRERTQASASAVVEGVLLINQLLSEGNCGV